jgi:hypothetical protein
MNRSLVATICLALSMVTGAGHAQEAAFPSTPRFVAIIRLAQEGRSDSARTAIERYLDDTRQSDPLYPEALYTAATIASSGSEARLLFSRVAVEYAQSAWADKALLRLAQLDFGTGDTEAAINRVRRLMTDYPTSEIMASAALWGARAAFERRDYATGCPWITRGLDHAANDVETRNQLEFMRQRCVPGVTTPVDTAPPAPPLRTPEPRPADTSEARPAPPPPPARDSVPVSRAQAGEWRIQVAALSDPVSMRRVEGLIRNLGLTPYREPGPNGLTKLQAGPFASREAATARLDDLTRLVGGKPFVTRVDQR